MLVRAEGWEHPCDPGILYCTLSNVFVLYCLYIRERTAHGLLLAIVVSKVGVA
jgi:hypothetical protein